MLVLSRRRTRVISFAQTQAADDSQAPHLPITNADDLGRLPPRDLLRHGSQNHFLYFHRPLHRGLRVGNHAPHALLLSPPAKRTDHLLIRPDISCANDTAFLRRLTRRKWRANIRTPLKMAQVALPNSQTSVRFYAPFVPAKLSWVALADLPSYAAY